MMDVNGGSTDRKWLREILALELTTGAPWPSAAPLENK